MCESELADRQEAAQAALAAAEAANEAVGKEVERLETQAGNLADEETQLRKQTDDLARQQVSADDAASL